jgi:hypothetical protein
MTIKKIYYSILIKRQAPEGFEGKNFNTETQ